MQQETKKKPALNVKLLPASMKERYEAMGILPKKELPKKVYEVNVDRMKQKKLEKEQPIEEKLANIEIKATETKALEKAFLMLAEKKSSFRAEDVERILELLGVRLTPSEISLMIWEVDENLDGKVNWTEFLNMYKKCTLDKTGLEPKSLFHMVQFLMYLQPGRVRITVEDTLELLYVRFGRTNLDHEIRAIFGDEEKTKDGQEKEISFSEFLEKVNERAIQQRKDRKEEQIMMTQNNIDKFYMTEWIEAICLVKFDIEIGQIVEWVQPLNVLTDEELKTVSMSSFPDSNSFSQNEGSVKYVFRMKRSNRQYSLGFTLFMQRRDEDNPRGYSQKSMVILTNLPLVGFFYQILDLMNSLVGNIKAQMQVAYEMILKWEKPSNKLFQLPLFDKVLAIEIPAYITKKQLPQIEQNIDLSLKEMIQFDDIRERGQFQETDIYSALPFGLLSSLTKIWELVITNQPFMVVADSPNQGSDLILGAISLISPMTYANDYRPYFTIYDKEFHQIQQELDHGIVRSIIIAVTNPFFMKAFQKFPVIVHLQKGTITSQRELCSREDKSILKMLMPLKNAETKIINNSVIKKFYKNLTLEFIGMFEMYFACQTSPMKKFDEKEFLALLQVRKLEFQEMFEGKQKIIKLYVNFIRSANFLAYLNERKNVYIPKQ